MKLLHDSAIDDTFMGPHATQNPHIVHSLNPHIVHSFDIVVHGAIKRVKI